MRTLFQFLLYLALGIWIGALVFFGAAVAPVAFGELPPLFSNSAQGIHAAGVVVGDSLVRLHWIGMICGIICLLCLLLGALHYRRIVPEIVLVAAMLALTAYSQFSIIPRMNTARESVGGNIEAVAPNNPGRQIFDRLHLLSVRVEAVILICGVAALVVTTHLARREV